MKMYDDVEESFYCFLPKTETALTGQQDIECCIKHAKKNPGGVVIAQISDGNPIDGGYRLTGAWIPPEIADKLIAVIKEWREFTRIPAKN